MTFEEVCRLLARGHRCLLVSQADCSSVLWTKNAILSSDGEARDLCNCAQGNMCAKGFIYKHIETKMVKYTCFLTVFLPCFSPCFFFFHLVPQVEFWEVMKSRRSINLFSDQMWHCSYSFIVSRTFQQHNSIQGTRSQGKALTFTLMQTLIKMN